MIKRNRDIDELATRMAGAVDGESAIDVCAAAAMVCAFCLHVGIEPKEQPKCLEEIITFLRRLASSKPNGRAKNTKGVNAKRA